MAKKQVVVDLNLRGTESINELESTLEGINSELKNVDRNSESFETLSEQSRQVQGELHKIDRSLEPITSDEQIQSFKKLGEGIAGAFQVGGAAMLIFSEEAQENFEEIAKVVITVVAAMDGLGKIMEVFSTNTIRNLRATAIAWKRQAAAVVGASRTMKAALISTGVGALLVGVGLLIANWEKLIDLFDRSDKRRKAALNLEIEQNKNIISLYQDNITLLEKRQDLYDSFGNSKNLLNEANNLTIVEEKLKVVNEELEKTYNELDQFKIDKPEELDEIDDNLKDINELIEIYEESFDGGLLEKVYGGVLESLKNKRKELVNRIEELEVTEQIYDNQLIRLELDRQLLVLDEIRIKRKYDLLKINNQLIESQAKLDNQLTILIAKEHNSIKIYRNKLNSINDQLEAQREIVQVNMNYITISADAYEEEKRKLAALEAQKEALIIQEELRREQLEIEKEALQNEIIYNRNVSEANKTHQDNVGELNKELSILEASNQLYDARVSRLEAIQDVYEYLTRQREQLVNFDEKGYEIFLKNNEALIERVDGYDDMFQEQRDILSSVVEEGKVSEQLLDDESKKLAFMKSISDERINQLDNQRQALSVSNEILKNDLQHLNNLVDIEETQLERNKQLLQEKIIAQENATTDEEKVRLAGEIAQIELEIQGTTQTILGYNQQIDSTQGEIITNDNQIKIVNEEITNEKIKQNKAEVESKQNLEEQSRTYAKIQGFTEEFNEEIQAAGELISQTFQLLGAVYDNIAAKRQEDLDKWLEQNQDAFDEIQSMETSLKKRQEKLTEMLIDAEGDRYDQIKDELSNISNQQEANSEREKQLKREEAQMQYEIDMAEWKATKMNKAASIADAAINTAVAITQSLPNVVLTAIVSALGAAQIATISATPLPEKPEAPKMQRGGYVNGKSHSQGGELRELEDGEFVVNRKSTDKYAELLEAINSAGKMQNGGYVSSRPSSSASSTPLIDYDRMTESFVDAVRQQNLFVSVKEINTVNKRVQAVESKTSL